MTTAHEGYVMARFDALEARFKGTLAAEDYRLEALMGALGPLNGKRILDLGCGKGRFARHLRHAGAEVIGLDASAAMLQHARGLHRVRSTARCLPFAAGSFDAVIAVEVLEHVAEVSRVLEEIGRVLVPGGMVAVVDKNARSLNPVRPWLPSLAVKWIDERRGRWMYPAGSPVRERWFHPRAFQKILARLFEDARVEYLLAPSEARKAIFLMAPHVRQMVLWTARKPGGCLG
jgi:2-polyprenyl-6-hydroxyphenyl methylase/3-demethylubiquinone-9 3-methyltransferase